MAIAYDLATDFPTTASGTSATLTGHTVTGTNTVIFVSFYLVGSSDFVTGVTWAGVSLTQLAKSQLYSNRYHYIYGLVGAATGANDVVISLSSADQCIRPIVASYTGVSQTGLPDAVLIQGAGTVTWSISRTTIADNCWMAVRARANNAVATTAGGTTRVTTAAGDISLWADSNAAITPAGSYTISGTCTDSGENAQWAVTFAPAAAAAAANHWLLMGV